MAIAKPKGLLAELKKEVDVPESILVAEGLVIPVPTREQMKAYSEARDGEARLEAIYGDKYAEVCELFNDEPIHIWQAFHKRVMDEFFGRGADEVEGK